MNERFEKAAYTDLLSAVVGALEVPLPASATTDQAAYHRLLERRVSELQSALVLMLAYGADPWQFASVIRRRTDEAPVTYAPFKLTTDGADR
ncbi:hypothetical protein [Streptomyces goshikiensis]|uniref:hypothetical protein n=1 Tax=Streptomyces goshikiensis TaxID=1942 RepID=UPI002E144C30|nr:hypothetical protein OG224_16930 [Streptomyces goshikiensis]